MSTSIQKAELVARLCADRGITQRSTEQRRDPPRVNIVQLDNLRIIRDLGARNTEVWEEYNDDCGVAA